MKYGKNQGLSLLQVVQIDMTLVQCSQRYQKARNILVPTWHMNQSQRYFLGLHVQIHMLPNVKLLEHPVLIYMTHLSILSFL